MKALNTIVNLVVLMLLLSSCSNDESKNVVESNGIKDNKLDTVRITINSFNLYSELKREMEAVICNDQKIWFSAITMILWSQ
jgi:hypothetical protein